MSDQGSEIGPFEGYTVERMPDEIVLTFLGVESGDNISMTLTFMDAEDMGRALVEVSTGEAQ